MHAWYLPQALLHRAVLPRHMSTSDRGRRRLHVQHVERLRRRLLLRHFDCLARVQDAFCGRFGGRLGPVHVRTGLCRPHRCHDLSPPFPPTEKHAIATPPNATTATATATPPLGAARPAFHPARPALPGRPWTLRAPSARSPRCARTAFADPTWALATRATIRRPVPWGAALAVPAKRESALPHPP